MFAYTCFTSVFLFFIFLLDQKYILEMISDLFRLTLPEWTEDFPAALVSVGESTLCLTVIF